MNRIEQLFINRTKPILNVYFTAGHPRLNDTVEIINHLTNAGVDLIEVGIPYSDPLADGLTIQQSSQKALQNGMTLNLLFKQISQAREIVHTPLFLMGYYNQVMQYGTERFLQKAAEVGVDGLIIPDLPMDIFRNEHQANFKVFNISISFLITPQTSDERIRQADELTSGFIYVVSKSSITGTSGDISMAQKTYFQRINSFGLNSPKLVGFGIHDRDSFEVACKYADGAIIGSAFIRAIEKEGELEEKIDTFISGIR